VIEARGIHCSYQGGPAVLKGIDLTVRDGALIGIVGPNGSGKTTLLRCLSGVMRPSRGDILLDRTPIRSYSPKELARRISFLGQGSDYGFDYSVREIVSMGRYAHTRFFEWGGSKDHDAIAAALASAGAMHLSDRQYSDLSGGEKQRVNIARCLAQGARTMLLDEPTHDLDIRGSSDLSSLIKRLNRERGMTVVAVMHDLSLALRTFHEIVLLSDGAVQAFGPPEESLTEASLKRAFGIAVSVDHGRGTIVHD
jgi:iron complex transport system ATP-binding protein